MCGNIRKLEQNELRQEAKADFCWDAMSLLRLVASWLQGKVRLSCAARTPQMLNCKNGCLVYSCLIVIECNGLCQKVS